MSDGKETTIGDILETPISEATEDNHSGLVTDDNWKEQAQAEKEALTTEPVTDEQREVAKDQIPEKVKEAMAILQEACPGYILGFATDVGDGQFGGHISVNGHPEMLSQLLPDIVSQTTGYVMQAGYQMGMQAIKQQMVQQQHMTQLKDEAGKAEGLKLPE